MKTDKINPDHYHPHGIITHEPIEIMKSMLTPDAYRGYLVGNVIKYVSRYDKKNGVEDLEKAKKYIDFLDNNKEFITTYTKVGDTIAISKRRDNNE